MSEISLPSEPSAADYPPSTRAVARELVLNSHAWGMIAFLVSEAAFFCTLIVVYLAFVGSVQSGPTPAVLSLPLVIVMTVCLLSSSVTIHLAERSLRSGARSIFLRWWLATIALGIAFLAGTAHEWNHLICEHGLTISRNTFGTTYYTLVGIHGLHVTVGVIVMLIMLKFAKLPSPVGRGAGGEGLGGGRDEKLATALPSALTLTLSRRERGWLNPLASSWSPGIGTLSTPFG